MPQASDPLSNQASDDTTSSASDGDTPAREEAVEERKRRQQRRPRREPEDSIAEKTSASENDPMTDLGTTKSPTETSQDTSGGSGVPEDIEEKIRDRSNTGAKDAGTDSSSSSTASSPSGTPGSGGPARAPETTQTTAVEVDTFTDGESGPGFVGTTDSGRSGGQQSNTPASGGPAPSPEDTTGTGGSGPPQPREFDTEDTTSSDAPTADDTTSDSQQEPPLEGTPNDPVGLEDNSASPYQSDARELETRIVSQSPYITRDDIQIERENGELVPKFSGAAAATWQQIQSRAAADQLGTTPGDVSVSPTGSVEAETETGETAIELSGINQRFSEKYPDAQNISITQASDDIYQVRVVTSEGETVERTVPTSRDAAENISEAIDARFQKAQAVNTLGEGFRGDVNASIGGAGERTQFTESDVQKARAVNDVLAGQTGDVNASIGGGDEVTVLSETDVKKAEAASELSGESKTQVNASLQGGDVGQAEQAGNINWSRAIDPLGLLSVSRTDEVEQSVEKIGDTLVRTGTQVGTFGAGLARISIDDGDDTGEFNELDIDELEQAYQEEGVSGIVNVVSETGQAKIDAPGKRGEMAQVIFASPFYLASAPAQAVNFGMESVEAGKYIGTGFLEGEGVEATQTVSTVAGESGRRVVETGINNPFVTTTQLVATAGASVKLFNVAKKAGPRASAVTRYAIQPGEELLGVGGFKATRTVGDRIPGVDGDAAAQRFFPNQEPLIFSEEAAIRAGRKAYRGVARRTPSGRRLAERAVSRTPKVSVEVDADAGIVEVDPELQRSLREAPTSAVETITGAPEKVIGAAQRRGRIAALRAADQPSRRAANAIVEGIENAPSPGRVIRREAKSARFKASEAARLQAERAASRAEARPARETGEQLTERIEQEITSLRFQTAETPVELARRWEAVEGLDLASDALERELVSLRFGAAESVTRQIQRARARARARPGRELGHNIARQVQREATSLRFEGAEAFREVERLGNWFDRAGFAAGRRAGDTVQRTRDLSPARVLSEIETGAGDLRETASDLRDVTIRIEARGSDDASSMPLRNLEMFDVEGTLEEPTSASESSVDIDDDVADMELDVDTEDFATARGTGREMASVGVTRVRRNPFELDVFAGRRGVSIEPVLGVEDVTEPQLAFGVEGIEADVGVAEEFDYGLVEDAAVVDVSAGDVEPVFDDQRNTVGVVFEPTLAVEAVGIGVETATRNASMIEGITETRRESEVELEWEGEGEAEVEVEVFPSDNKREDEPLVFGFTGASLEFRRELVDPLSGPDVEPPDFGAPVIGGVLE